MVVPCGGPKLKVSPYIHLMLLLFQSSHFLFAVFRRTWTDAEELLKEKPFFILSFVFLSEFVIRQVQTNIYQLLDVEILCNLLWLSEKHCLHFSRH